MAVNDFMDSSFDADSARYDRMNRTQPAPFAPGQDGVFESQNAFAQSSVQNDSSGVGDIFSTGAGLGGANPSGDLFGQGGSGIPMGNTVQPPQMQQQKSQEDVFFDAVKVGAKGTFNIVKELGESFSLLTPRWYSEWGRSVFWTGIVVGCVGFVSRLFGFGAGLKLTVGGFASAAGGVVIWFLLTEKAKNYTNKYKDEKNSAQSFNQPSVDVPTSDGMDFGTSFSEPMEDSSESFGFDSFGFADEDEDEDEDEFFGAYSDEEEDEPEEGMSPEDALNSLPEVPKGMYERNYLWDMFTKVLPSMKPGFAEIKEIDEDEDAFLYWDEKLREVAEVVGCKEDNLPNLLKLQENLFTIIVTCDRPTGFKPEPIANELANVYAYKDGEKNENVFAKVDTIGQECKITIFNGVSAMISLKDMMMQEKDFFLDSKNYIPAVIGVDQLGKVIRVNLKNLESIIVTGMPRSGKSWFVQSILTQMCAFIPPSELHLYIGDPKEGISDFRAFTLPHVKKFVSEDAKIVSMMRHLVKVEGPRRKKIIGDAGFVNIWDYKSRYPDVKLPIIYVVVDEIVTLASRMDKETGVEFRMLLRELISQLPALGIRAFLIPHVLNNDIIEKKTSDLVPCKVSVKGNADHIEKATGAKPKEFPYKLVNPGDMAVRLANIPNVIYVHAPAITESNPKNNELFDYLRRVWSKLEPEEVYGSVSEGVDIERENAKVLEQLSDVSEDIEVWSNSNENGLSGMVSEDDSEEISLF